MGEDDDSVPRTTTEYGAEDELREHIEHLKERGLLANVDAESVLE